MTAEPSRPPATRLSAERHEAHRQYNEALTALDRAIQALPGWPEPPPAYDETMLPGVNDAWRVVPGEEPPRPAGWRGRLADAIWQVVSPFFERQMAFNAALVDHLNRNAAAHREAHLTLARALPATREGFEALVRFESLLVQFLQRITPLADANNRELREAIDEVRHVAEVAQRAAVMARREIDRLGAAPITEVSGAVGGGLGSAAPAVARTDAYKYLGFEDRFRGSEADIRARLEDYVPYFEGARDVLDVGCGRGEFLELLKARGIAARGLDLNTEMVEACLARGLEASAGDALPVLAALPDRSLGGLIAVQVIEHLDPGYLSDFLQTAYHKLRPGSCIVLETINPACWVAFFESYIRDLTHVRPIHPETLQYMLHASGFGSVELVYRSPIAEAARLERVTPRPVHFGEADLDPVTELVSAFNRNMDRLNGRLFTFQDFAAVARVPNLKSEK